MELANIAGEFVGNYRSSTSRKVKLIDAFIMFQLATLLVQLVYMLMVGTFPYNSFLSGFAAAGISAVLTVSLRKQVVCPEDFNNISHERAFADYAVCNAILFLTVMNFMG